MVYGAVVRHGAFGQYGNALLARGPIRDVDLFALPRPSQRQRRGALLARITLPECELTVAVTHLQHHRSDFEEAQREAPMQLGALLERVALRPAPRVVLGDMNLGASRVGPLLAAAGFVAAPTPPTFPRDAPRVTLDYVAVQGLRVLDVHVVSTTISDHRAVVATLGDSPS